MAFSYQKLTEITTLPTTAGAIYTNPDATITYVRLIVLHNAGANVEDVKLYNVPDSSGAVGTAVTTNEFYAEGLNPGDTRLIEFAVPGLMLTDTNDTIQGVTTNANSVTVQMFGGKE